MVVNRHIVTCSLQKSHVWEKRTGRERVGNVTGKVERWVTPNKIEINSQVGSFITNANTNQVFFSLRNNDIWQKYSQRFRYNWENKQRLKLLKETQIGYEYTRDQYLSLFDKFYTCHYFIIFKIKNRRQEHVIL